MNIRRQSKKNKYTKQSIDELINHLEEKNVQFNIMSKEEASYILRDLNYYYKLTVYKRNFKRDSNGKFKELEFSYLTDLASTDMQLRYLLLASTLDIEHSLKTFLLTHITENEQTDGYDIIHSFFHSTKNTSKPLDKEILLKNAKRKGHYQYNLYETHKDDPPAWVVMEVINFNDFIKLFKFYFKTYPNEEFNANSITGVLHSVRFIRNACAHSNPFLFDLHRSEIKHLNGYVKNYAKELGVGQLFYKCNKVHDLLAVFYIHQNFIKGEGSKHYRKKEFEELTNRSIERFSYMNKDNDILEFFNILKKILDKYNI